MADIIEDYHWELVPLIVPVTMLRHDVEKAGKPNSYDWPRADESDRQAVYE